jgi:dinuclear metal center YbgI/SA1388 family protein
MPAHPILQRQAAIDGVPGLMAVRVRDAVRELDRLSPPNLALDWDKIGLQVGNPASEVSGVLFALDVTGSVVKQAVKKRDNLIVSHHPLLFNPLSRLNENNLHEKLIRDLVKADISVYVAHTNLDIAPGGTNYYLAERLGLEISGHLQEGLGEKYYKLVVFVPNGHEGRIIEAIAKGGGGVIGRYDHCTFRTPGTGTYIPREGANPFQGRAGKLESAEECRLEAVVPGHARKAVIGSVRSAHPYEEPAYDLYALENEVNEGGLGVIGELKKETSLLRLSSRTARLLGNNTARYTGDPDRTVKRVAVCTGSGGDLIPAALMSGVDCYITGDIKYHAARDAERDGLCLIDAGHYETEVFFIPRWAEYLQEVIPEISSRVHVAEEKGPFKPAGKK